MKEIFFSIIIPTYNRASFIKNTINSVLQQTYKHFEVIVVDDGSTDNTGAIVKAIEDKRVSYYLKQNGERAAARNFGTSKAKGNYINFFDSDDLLYLNHLATAKTIIDSAEKIEVFHLGYDFKKPSGELISKFNFIADINAALPDGNCLSCNGVFLRRDIAKTNPFPENRRMAASEDYALWLHLASQFKILSSPIITSTVIEHDARSVISMNVDRLIQRQHLFIDYITNNLTINQNYSKAEILKIKGGTLLYVALHIALTKTNRRKAIQYYLKGITTYPQLLFSRRTLGFFKRLFI